MEKIFLETFERMKKLEYSFIVNKTAYDAILQFKEYIGFRKFGNLYLNSNVVRNSNNWCLNYEYNVVEIKEDNPDILFLIQIENIIQSADNNSNVDFEKVLQLLVRTTSNDIRFFWRIFKDALVDYNLVFFNNEVGADLTPLKFSQKFDEYIIPMTSKSKAFFINSEIVEASKTDIIFTGCLNLDTNAVSYLRNIVLGSIKNDKELTLYQILEEANHKNLDLNGNPYYIENLVKAKEDKTLFPYYIENMTIYNVLKDGTISDLFDYTKSTFRKGKLYQKANKDAQAFYDEYKDEKIFQMLHILDMIRALLLKTALLKYSSNKSPENKLHELLEFINNNIGALLSREIQICFSYLNNEDYTKDFFKKIQKGREISNDVLGMAWDLFHLRLTYINYTPIDDKHALDYNYFLTFDNGIKKIIKETELIALIRRNNSKSNITPVFDSKLNNMEFKSKTLKEASNEEKRFSNINDKSEGLLNLVISLEEEWRLLMVE